MAVCYTAYICRNISPITTFNNLVCELKSHGITILLSKIATLLLKLPMNNFVMIVSIDLSFPFSNILLELKISFKIGHFLNLTYPKLDDFQWYKDMFPTRVLFHEDCNQSFWKERLFLDFLNILLKECKIPSDFTIMILFLVLSLLMARSQTQGKVKVRKNWESKRTWIIRWSIWFGKNVPPSSRL